LRTPSAIIQYSRAIITIINTFRAGCNINIKVMVLAVTGHIITIINSETVIGTNSTDLISNTVFAFVITFEAN
jgi:hypothetical protein